MSLHPRLDLEHWCRRLPPVPGPRRWWQFWRGEPRPPEIVHGPLDVAGVEFWRRSHPPRGRTTPADWFVWSTQPARHPFLTRLGGVPHREAHAAWPLTPKGQPRLFIGQFCFLDSLDIVDPPLPGDVLLIFGAADQSGGSIDPEHYHLEWSMQHLRSPTQRSDLPTQPIRLPELSGVIHRTVEEWDGVTQGTKIGARTLLIQDTAFENEALLCALSYFSPRGPWPTIEHEGLDKRAAAALGEFDLCDAGCIYVVRFDDGSLEAWSDCY